MDRAALDDSSSDVTFLCHAPQMLAAAYRRAQSGVGDARERLGWRLGLADAIQRYLLGVLAAECAGLGLPAPDAYLRLIDKLATPSLGDWLRAAQELAGGVLSAGRHPVAGEFALVLADPDGRKSQEAGQLKALIDLRNDLFHRDGAPLPDEGTARKCLEDIDAPLRCVCRSLRFLRDYPLLYAVERRELQDGTRVATVLRFRGVEPGTVRIETLEELRVPEKVPFLMNAEGDVLMLPPYVVVGRNQRSGQLEARLLCGWDEQGREFQYSELHGGARGPVPTEGSLPIADRRALVTLAPAVVRRDGVAPASFRSRVHDECASEDSPSVPGYRINGVIGRGASSTVWLAREMLCDRPPSPLVAVKVLNPVVAQDPGQRARFRREHEVLRVQQHPVVVKVHRLEEESWPPYIVMDYVQGEDLQARVESKPLTAGHAMQVCRDVLDALEAVHARGVYHRDIKPSNIMIDRNGGTRLIDFGIATAEHLSGMTATLEALGTLDFAAPEQLHRAEDVDARADLYSLGRVLEFAITGEVGAVAAGRSSLPSGLQAIVRKATQAEPIHRYQTAGEMRQALEERAAGGWEGAPVESGDRLDESFELGSLQGTRDGLSAFDGVALLTDEHVTIVLGPAGSDADERLRRAVRDTDGNVRRSLDYRSLLRTHDRIPYAVLGAGHAMRRLECLLEGRPFRAPRPSPRAPAQPVGPASPAAHLAGFAEWLRHARASLTGEGPTPGDGLQAAWQLELVVVVTSAHLAAAHGRLDLGARPHALRSLGESARWLESAVARSGRSGWEHALAALREAVGARNRFVHTPGGPADLTVTMTAIITAGSLLLDRANALAADVPVERLYPVVRMMEDGQWAVLQASGSRLQYVGIAREPPRYDVPADDADELVRLVEGMDHADHRLRARQVEVVADLERLALEALSALPFVSRIVTSAQAPFHERRIEVDALALTLHRTPLCIVECRLRLTDSSMIPLMDRMWTYATAFRTPFAGMTDGSDWVWYAVDPQAGLQRLPEGFKALEQHAASVRGEYESALDFLRHELRHATNGDDPPAVCDRVRRETRLAMALFELGRLKQAEAQYRKAVRRARRLYQALPGVIGVVTAYRDASAALLEFVIDRGDEGEKAALEGVISDLSRRIDADIPF